ncbi:pentapeptide repeat-containing protein [Halomonas sp. CH40]
MRKLAIWLEKHWLIRTLDSLAKFGILIAVISWAIDIPERNEQREIAKRLVVYQAHEVLALAHFRSSTAAGMALEDLINAQQDLIGMDLTSLTIYNVDLSNADFREADFHDSSLRSVELIGANLSNAEFTATTFDDVDMAGANLSGAYFNGVDLRGAKNIVSAQISLAIVCNNTELPGHISGIERGLTKDQEKKWREKYSNNAFIQNSIESCGVRE